MAKTMVQQSQISGSLAFDDTLAAGSSLAGKQSIVGDLDALRSQINKIIGGDRWYDALSGSQDLADIYAAVHMSGANADFQGTLDVTGVATFDAAITGSMGLQLGGDLDVNSTADFQGAVNLQDTLTVAQAADLNGSLDVAGQVDLADSGVGTSIRGTLSVAEVATFSAAMTGSAGMQLAGDLDVNSSADFQGAVNLQSTLDVGGDAHFTGAIVDVDGTLSASVIKIDGDSPAGALYLVGAAGEIAEEGKLVFSNDSLGITGALDVSGVVDAGELYVGGPTGLSGTLAVNGVSDFAANVYMASDLYVSGAMQVSQGLTVTGDRLEVTGSFGVSGVSDFGDDVSIAGDVAIAGDVQHRLYIVDTDANGNVIKDEAKLTFDGSELYIDGDLEVAGGDITLSNSMSISSATAGKLVLTGDLVEVSGDLKVAGNDISGSAGLNISLESDGDVTIAGDLKLMGNELKSSAGNVVLELSGDDAYFKSDVHVAGKLFVDQDFIVQGTLTQIDTTNLRVEDAFIYLATGSLGTTDSGIVLHGGAGAGMDLVMGQDGGAGEFIFGKGNRAPDGDGAMNDIELVPAWMSSLKVGAHEGSLSGSLSVSAAGMSLQSETGKDLLVKAGTADGSDLLLQANGENAISFIESGEWAAFNAQFPGQSLVSAIVAAGGNFKQDAFLPGVTTAGDLIDFEAALGFELRTAAIASSALKKLAMDVYLNGVRLAYGEDYEIESETEISLQMNTMADDRLAVVVHNAAP